MNELDKLIAEAPEVPPPAFNFNAYDDLSWDLRKAKRNGLEREIKVLWEAYTLFPKVQYGTYSLLNCKSVLRAFRKKRAYAPRKPKGRAGTRRLNKRTLYEDVNYSVPYTPRKVTKLPESMSHHPDAGLYVDGFFCNRHYMVRIDKPKTKRPLICEYDLMSNIIKEATVRNGELAVISKETFNGAEGGDKPIAHINGATTSTIVDARNLDIIFKYHPDAQIWLEGKVVNFFMGTELVGMVMPVTY